MSRKPEKKTLAIVGLGLIGASIAEATRKRYPDWQIIGVSSSNTTKEALELGIIHQEFDYMEVRQAIEQCDLAFLCIPIDHILEMLRAWKKDEPPKLKPKAIISDVGSTKAEICALGREVFPPESGGFFIGSHPMAGSEKTGLKARDGHLFENATWIICKHPEDPDSASHILQNFVVGLGARHILSLDPELHDLTVALSSHTPQLLSTALAAFISRQPGLNDIAEAAGWGFRDMTRLAASKFSVWEPILRTNQKNLLKILPLFRKELEKLEVSLSLEDGGRKFFEDANKLRDRFSLPRKGFSSPTTEILVDLEDKPGELLAALKPLSGAGINILDLEILKVREGEEGVLMMGFRKPGEAQTALDLLAKSGHKARLR